MRFEVGIKINGAHAGSAKHYKVSEDRNYAVGAQHKDGTEKDGSKSVYVRNGGAPPLGSRRGGKRIQMGGDVFEQYMPTRAAFNDCGHHTEEIMSGRRLPYGEDVFSQSATIPGRDWGEGHDENVALSRDVSRRSPGNVDHFASPQPGEGYVTQGQVTERMLGNGWNTRTENPYHAAPVVARGGNSTVTLEASAPTGAGGNHEPGYSEQARYYMQTVGSEVDSFHAQMLNDYTASKSGRAAPQPPITHIIKPK